MLADLSEFYGGLSASFPYPHIYIKRASNILFVNNEDLLERITINSSIILKNMMQRIVWTAKSVLPLGLKSHSSERISSRSNSDQTGRLGYSSGTGQNLSG